MKSITVKQPLASLIVEGIKDMENVPEKIYLDLGRNCPNDCDFNELSQVTWSQDNATGNGIEFTRSDIAGSKP